MKSRIVIIEDEPLIALDLEQAILEVGCEVVGKAHSLADGLDLLDTAAFDGAVVDANLAGESAEPIVRRLEQIQMPCLVVSGYSREQLSFLQDGTPLLGKPFGLDELTDSLRAHLLSPTGAPGRADPR